MKGYIMSRKLKEYSEFFMNEVYMKDNLVIMNVANWSDENILCFWVMKLLGDGNYDFCRISMTEPKYINAENESLRLNEYEINEMIRALSTNYTGDMGWNDDYIFPRNWDFMIAQLNDDHKSTYPNENLVWKDIPSNLPIPDYRLLLEDK